MKKIHEIAMLASALMLFVNAQADTAGEFPPKKVDVNKPTAVAKQQAQAPAGVPQTPQQGSVVGYLGMGFDKVPKSITAHYPEGISDKQGLVVTRFATNSPAADDGLKQYDVLISYDGEPIDDPQKFINKIRADKPGRTVNFKLIRQGELLTIPVKMGSQKVKARPQVRPQMAQQYRQMMPGQMQGRATPNAAMPSAPPSLNNFNGLIIRKIDKDNEIYEASIGVPAANGTFQRRAFKGNRQQIYQQVMQARDLPPQAKQQLIYAVRPPQKNDNGWGNMPFGNSKMFNPGKFFNGWGW